jgi:hypothetical protein
MNEDQQRRPDPVRWIWYTFAGALGPRYREWVLHERIASPSMDTRGARPGASTASATGRKILIGCAATCRPIATKRLKPHAAVTQTLGRMLRRWWEGT